MTHRLLKSAALALLVVANADPASADVRYVGTRIVGAGTVELSILTDGRTGVLSAADLLSWSITLRDPTSAIPLRILTEDGAGGTVRSSTVVAGPAVSANRTELIFTYGVGDFEFDAASTVRPFYQLVSSGCSTGYLGETRACEQFDTGSDFSSRHVEYSIHPPAGTVVLATAAAVPEPSAWMLMIAGFGLAGCVLRRGASGLNSTSRRPAPEGSL